MYMHVYGFICIYFIKFHLLLNENSVAELFTCIYRIVCMSFCIVMDGSVLSLFILALTIFKCCKLFIQKL